MSNGSKKVTLIDYGIGNLYSVRRALEVSGGEVTIAGDAAGIDSAQRLVLPGVGAFPDGMRGLRERGLVDPLRRYASSDRPLLGICLGMQMLAGTSMEFGVHEGLGIVPGRVVPIPPRDASGRPHKIPHIGWSAIEPDNEWRDTLLADTSAGTAVYLVHSFHVVPDHRAHMLASCDYGGHRVTAAIRSGRTVGCQFHPEKSGAAGLRILAAFLGGTAG